MAWTTVTVKINGEEFLGHVKDSAFTLPCSTGLEVGNSFKVGTKGFTVLDATDVGGRGEVLLINTQSEVKNDKPKTRRNADNAG
tara:strand:+ start:389 stop:640 length:252 start_codon:yes stop_codon:yes gene_type:complete